jgi:tetratricopeptide (TPR) repeat protein
VRFDKLEFERNDPRPAAADAADRVEKDEKHWAAMAEQHRQTGNYEMALRFYSRALEVDKTLVPAWVGQVQMLVQLDEYPQASLWSQKALELFPSHGDLLAGQAQAECRMGNVNKAYSLSDGALRQRGESAYRWQVRGELVVASKDKTDRHCFDKAQVVDNHWLVPLESALIYAYYKFHSKAQQRAQAAIEKAPDAHYAWYVLGLCQSKLGFETAAVNSLRRCLELCPRHAESLSLVADLERPKGLLGRLAGRLRRR